jgi:hypothetical protein
MLPGFRFLFAAIILSMSVLVFGLGAAAFLRAAHEQFASIPSRRAPPEPVFAQQGEPPMPTLALLRFEPAVAEKEPDTAPDNVAAVASAATETPAAPVFDATPAEPEKLAALQSQETVAAEPAKPEVAAAGTAPVTQAAPAETPAAQTSVANDEVKVAAIAEPPPPVTVAASTTPEPVAEPSSLEGNIATTKIATLGGSAVTIADPGSAKPKSAKPDRSAIQKRAQRAKELRRIAARRAAALQAQQAAALPQPNPFDPAPVTRAKR